MIQRIQSIWLLLAAVFAFLTMKFSFYSGNIIDAATNAKVFQQLNAVAKDNLILTVLTVSVAVASLVAIFLYKDRKRQLMVVAAIAVVAVINIVIYFLQSKKFVPNEGSLDLTSLLTFFIPVFLLLAIRNIWKDEKLVKSTDRLR